MVVWRTPALAMNRTTVGTRVKATKARVSRVFRREPSTRLRRSKTSLKRLRIRKKITRISRSVTTDNSAKSKRWPAKGMSSADRAISDSTKKIKPINIAATRATESSRRLLFLSCSRVGDFTRRVLLSQPVHHRRTRNGARPHV